MSRSAQWIVQEFNRTEPRRVRFQIVSYGGEYADVVGEFATVEMAEAYIARHAYLKHESIRIVEVT